AAALYLRPRAQWLLLAGLLAGWWALLLGGGTLEPYANIASRIDDALLGPWLYQHDAAGRGHDPEGLPGTLGALATTLLGLRAGDWLRHGRLRRLVGAAALALLGPWLYQHDAAGRGHDPEGLPGTLGALATTLLGLRAGDWLRHGRLRRLVGAAALALLLGLACAPWMPWNKNLWTPSYVLWS